MDDESDRPATVGHFRDLASKIEDIDAATRRIEQRETETWAYRQETYVWLRDLQSRRFPWLAFAVGIIGFMLGRLSA